MSTKQRDLVLGAIGLAALACYILACGPAFSPDDSKVLFASNDPQTGHAVMALYDRRTHATRNLLSLPIGNDDSPPAYAWTPDGNQAVALWTEGDDALRIATVPLRAGATPRLLAIDDFDSDSLMYLYWHPAVVGGAVFVGGKTRIRRIDLVTGDQATAAVDGKTRLVACSGRLYYERELPDADAATGRVEFGLLDASTLALSPQFTATGVGSDLMAVSGDGTRIAVDALDSDAGRILVFERGRLLATLALDAAAKEASIAGSPEWSRDAKSLYATYRLPLDAARSQYGLAVLPVDGSQPVLQPLLVAGSKDGLMPLDVSHDGGTLATVSTYLQTPVAELAAAKKPNLEPKDLALYLIDLASPRRAVTKVAVPPLHAVETPVGR